MSESNSDKETYHQKNMDVILNREKYYYKNNEKKDYESKQDISTEIYLKKKK